MTRLARAVVLLASMAPAAMAQDTVVTTAPAPLPPVDPARLAAARPVVDRVWPPGTYARMLQASLNMVGRTAAGAIGEAIANDPAAQAELAPPPPTDRRTPAERAADGKTRRDTMHAASEQMNTAFTALEPPLREALAKAYARQFTTAELGELRRFFDTPAGRHYAGESLLLMSSPEVMEATMAATQRMIGGMAPADPPKAGKR